MKLSELQNMKIFPQKNLVAFQWLKPKTSKYGILIPEQFYNIGLKVGQFYIGKVLAVGKKVKEIKNGDSILVHEYGVKNFPGSWKEDYVYFIEEKFCKCRLVGLEEEIPIIFREVTREEKGCG